MKLQILYDNNSMGNFKSGWGFSCYIETKDDKILFDTGWNGNILLHNMEVMGLNPYEIKKVVISHSHWDHIGGLNHILTYNQPEIFIPKSASKNLKNEIKRYSDVIEIFDKQEISNGVWTTGELGDDIKEQSLIMGTDKGNVILTGCAHPGLENILGKLGDIADIHAVVGGFHDSNVDILNGIPFIIPCHCTEKIDEIRKNYPESFRECQAGTVFDF
jgi:7,8-dihydropterin-6-yl-methyl-4-(beta-D-ribofuranosyl)aminobenzene 5'-phosphate synthase